MWKTEKVVKVIQDQVSMIQGMGVGFMEQDDIDIEVRDMMEVLEIPAGEQDLFTILRRSFIYEFHRQNPWD